MKRTELLKALSIKKQFNFVYRYLAMLLLCLLALTLGWIYQDRLFGLFITSAVLGALFFFFVCHASFPIFTALLLAKTYRPYEGRVVETHENRALKSVFLTIEYESPAVTRITTASCFYPLDGKVLFNKRLRIAVSPKSTKAIVLP